MVDAAINSDYYLFCQSGKKVSRMFGDHYLLIFKKKTMQYAIRPWQVKRQEQSSHRFNFNSIATNTFFDRKTTTHILFTESLAKATPWNGEREREKEEEKVEKEDNGKIKLKCQVSNFLNQSQDTNW